MRLPLLTTKEQQSIDAASIGAAANADQTVVHELAHLKEQAHDKAFYKLCHHMEPQYAQLEFDLRLYLTQCDLAAETVSRG